MIDERQIDLTAAPIITGNTKAAVKEAGGGSSDLWMIAPSKLFHDAHDNARPLDKARVAHYTALMLANGYDKTKPIGCFVRKVGEENRIHVHDGQHRYFAALAAIESGNWSRPEVAFDRVPVVIRDARTVDRKTLIITGIIANDGERLTPLELAGRIAELQREGMTQAEVCAQLNITSQTVRDVMLLLDAPATLHNLIREKAITSTLAITTIRDVGPAKALDVIEKALSVATKNGRTKVTQKNLELPTSLKGKPAKKAPAKAKGGSIEISNRLAKQLLFAAVAAYSDGDFCEDSPGYVEIVATLSEFCTLDTDADKARWIASANEHGMLNDEATETIESPKWGRDWVQIRVARASVDDWHATGCSHIGTTFQSGPVSNRSRRYGSRRIAIALGAIAFAERIRGGHNPSRHKHTTRAVEWLEDLAVRALLGDV